MFHIIDEHFFMPLASPNKVVYWECICKLFSVMDHQLSFGVERDVLVEELQYYFEASQATDIVGEDVEGKSARGKANWMIRKLENYGWIDIEQLACDGQSKGIEIRRPIGLVHCRITQRFKI